MFYELHAPGYLHLMINHVPIIGTAMGLFGVIVALFLKSRLALVPALAILILAGLSAWPVAATGGSAYRPVMKIADHTGRDWLNEHRDRADRTLWVFYFMAGVATFALIVPCKWPQSAVALGMAAALSAFVGLGVAGYIAQAGGPVRHTELRVPGLTLPSN